METAIHQKMLALIVIGLFVNVPRRAVGDWVCGGEMETDWNPILDDVLTTCYPQAPPVSQHLQICAGSRLDCASLRNVFQVIPSCEYCSRNGEHDIRCHNSQLNATKCSVNHFIRSSFQCVKAGNGKSCDQCNVAYTKGIPPATDGGVFLTTAETVTEANEVGITDFHRNKKCPPCHPCNCEQSEEDRGGIGVGLSIGLFFIGLIIGIVCTMLVFLCIPSLQRKSNVLHGEVTEKINRPSIDLDKPPQLQTAGQAVTMTNNISTGQNQRVLPSAPPGTGSFQAGYHTLNSMGNARDSHMYTGLQENNYQEPMGNGVTYQDTHDLPIRAKNSVASPVYQEFQDGVIPGAGAKSKPSAKPSNATNNVTGSTNASSDASNDRQSQYGHHYFVLEEENSQSNDCTTDAPYHDYFVLEKDHS